MSVITPVIQRWIDEGRRDPDALWASAARELRWFGQCDRVFESETQRYLDYTDLKLAYWHPVESGNERAAASIVERLMKHVKAGRRSDRAAPRSARISLRSD